MPAMQKLLQQYYKITFLAVSSSDPEEILSLVNKRDELISQMKEAHIMDETEVDQTVQQIVDNILVLEADLAKKMEQLKQEAKDQLSSINSSKKLRNQYEQMYAMTDGAFYDKRG